MASLRQMKDWGMGLVILGIMFGIGLAVLGDVQEGLMDDSGEEPEPTDASEAVGDAIGALGEFTGWFGLIALVVVAAIIITLVQSGFGSNGGGNNPRRRYGRA